MSEASAPSSGSKSNIGRHVIVIGGSMTGLLHARILANYFEQVTIIDRDTFPEMPDHRKGVPQSYHAHALLARGQQIINQMFPGILDDLRVDGALSISDVVPFVIVSPAGKFPSVKNEGKFVAFSRYRLEWHVRHRLSQQPNIRFLSNRDVISLLSTPDHMRVTGVQLRERGEEGHVDTLIADLVVDASGRHSQAPRWLTDLGYAPPPEEIINSGLGYASRFYARPANFPSEWQGLIINSRPPHNPRAGLILPIEDDKWHVTLAGFAGNYPPGDEEGFMQWARDLPDPSLYEALRVAQPLTPIRGYRTPENRVRRFEKLERWPRGFIVTGDAVCAFNPIFGQGMTVSAMDALTLEECLRNQQHSPRADFEQHFQQQLARTIAGAWLVASGEDLRWPTVTLRGARPPLGMGLLHRFLDLVMRSAVEDVVVYQVYMGVVGMMAPPQSLASPRILMRVLRSALKRATGRSVPSSPFALSPEALAMLRARDEVKYESLKV